MRAILFIPLLLMATFEKEPISGITFLDIGTGDSTLVTIGEDTILIDAGPVDNILFEFEHIPQEIDLLVITHPHEDHLSGARYILERYEVKQIVIPDICNISPMELFYPSGSYVNNAEIVKIDNSDMYHIMYPIEEVSFKMFLPRFSVNSDEGCISADSSDAINDNSVVTEITFRDSKILMMGDVERSGELALVRSGSLSGNFTILKAGHHCSDTSSTESFLRVVRPEFIVCSTGKSNPYGHPSKDVMDRAHSLGIEVHLTYRDGSLFIPFKDQ